MSPTYETRLQPSHAPAPVRPRAEQTHHVVRWPEFGHGGPFAALDTPDVLVTELREFFRSLA
ncbi:hypothetical protein E1295_18600 [Nonomuraea mesophila]|uniref:Alpha/beta hydrolase n=1 Tax=Nonomuraea mesophila TaxID=2530382 RepID=A0A4R5FHV3_9ACTN|nr:hypothetical protein [Nonomuraea mesophila]TDE51216.1 hypothetical protein E1295_18600 [Nonomuraea mesophila]